MLKTKEVSVSTNIQNLSNSDTVNLQDDKPTIIFGPRVENKKVDIYHRCNFASLSKSVKTNGHLYFCYLDSLDQW